MTGARRLKHAFGDRVIVRSETVRVNRRIEDGVPVFWQSYRSRERVRFGERDLSDANTWPGAPVPLDWESPVSDKYVLEPDDTLVTVRLRRLPLSHPQVGLVIGYTHKSEGSVYEGVSFDGEHAPRSLGGPGRRIDLLEVALAPPARGKTRLVLVHPRDALPVPTDT